ncbi:molecular chaperone [Teichococcus deserti]|uniref:fimbrial biogenesis chaperone n=1 Tax=Teichococcus deserti TaxID=1817963 RepID=UPI0009F84D89|nr:molecular chaperone [Pseudoroseomonas deserti]
MPGNPILRPRRQLLLQAGGGLTLAALAWAPRPARAGAIEVAPVSADLAPGQQAGVITVTNRDTTPTSVQVRAFAWTQDVTSDQLTPTQDLLVSPPLFQLAPGASQVVRMVLRAPAQGRETAYRLLVDQIPGPTDSGQQIRFALRLSIPVFAQAAVNGRAELEWQLRPGGELTVVNRGTRRAQLAQLTLMPAGGRGPLALTGPENPYVLPGQERRWLARGATLRPGSTVQASGTGEAGRFTVDVPVSP